MISKYNQISNIIVIQGGICKEKLVYVSLSNYCLFYQVFFLFYFFRNISVSSSLNIRKLNISTETALEKGSVFIIFRFIVFLFSLSLISLELTLIQTPPPIL